MFDKECAPNFKSRKRMERHAKLRIRLRYRKTGVTLHRLRQRLKQEAYLTLAKKDDGFASIILAFVNLTPVYCIVYTWPSLKRPVIATVLTEEMVVNYWWGKKNHENWNFREGYYVQPNAHVGVESNRCCTNPLWAEQGNFD